MIDSRFEIDVLARYLLESKATELDFFLYERLMHLKICDFDKALDVRLWNWCLEHPTVFESVDLALGVFMPNSKIRKRLLFSLSLLEMSPEHSDKFLKPKTSKVQVLLKLSVLIKLPFLLMIGASVLLFFVFTDE